MVGMRRLVVVVAHMSQVLFWWWWWWRCVEAMDKAMVSSGSRCHMTVWQWGQESLVGHLDRMLLAKVHWERRCGWKGGLNDHWVRGGRRS